MNKVDTISTTATSQWPVYLILLIGIMSTGFSGIFVSLAGVPGTVASAYRMGIATLIMAPLFFYRRRQKPALARRDIGVAFLGGFFFAADLAFWNTGILISGATTPTLMGNTAPIWVGLGAFFIFREKLNRAFWVGLAIALTGVVIVLGADALQDVHLGTLLGLLAGICYGAYFLVTEYGRRTLDTLSYFWLSAVSATFWSLLATMMLGEPLLGYTQTSYLSLLALAVVVQIGGQQIYSYVLGELPASIVAPTGLLQPVITGILAGPLLGQYLQGGQIGGGLVVLLGVYVVHWSRRRV